MEIEILLDMDEVNAEDQPNIEKRIREWYAEGAEVRYDKFCFGSMSPVDPPTRFRVDLGQVDALTAIRDLHARLHRFGVKVFVHFMH